MSDFDPAALEAAQRDEMVVTFTREEALWVSRALRAGVRSTPIGSLATGHYDNATDLAAWLANFARTGIDEIDAVFCIACGQPDEPALHDPARCPGEYEEPR